MVDEETSYVVVFPTVFAMGRIPQLIEDVKKILQIKGQRFESARRDGDVILVHANDPVFASSAIGLVFGVRRVAIARRTENCFEEIVSQLATVGGRLLLKGERFLVRVEGAAKGFIARDVEVAATSRIIDRTAELGAVPGTEERFDKELYAYLTKKSAYVCIFSDAGIWGVPRYGGDERTTICPIYDELSALSCFEAMRQGYGVSIMVFYGRRSELLGLARLLNRLIPRLLEEEVELRFVQIPGGGAGRGGGGAAYLAYVSTVVETVLLHSAAGDRVALAVPPAIFSPGVTDALTARVFKADRIPLVPLAGTGGGMYEIAGEIGLGGAEIRRLEKMAGRRYDSGALAGQPAAAAVAPSSEPSPAPSPETIRVRAGVNNVHDILDSLGSSVAERG